MTAALLVAAVFPAAASYWAGRGRAGHRLLVWAEDRSYGPHTPGWWVAQVVGLVVVAWMVTVHPRRTAANRRSWREARDAKRAPAPQYDPHWATKRGAPDRSEDR